VQAYAKMLEWYQREQIGAIRRDLVEKKFTMATLPKSDVIAKQYFANVWHNEDREGCLLNYELTGRVCAHAHVPDTPLPLTGSPTRRRQITPKDLERDVGYDTFMLWHKYHLEFKMLKLTEQSHLRRRLVRSITVKDLDGCVVRAHRHPM
jgi:hypothetical protein